MSRLSTPQDFEFLRFWIILSTSSGDMADSENVGFLLAMILPTVSSGSLVFSFRFISEPNVTTKRQNKLG